MTKPIITYYRHIVVNALTEEGLSSRDIAEVLYTTKSNVKYIRGQRVDRMFSDIRKALKIHGTAKAR